MTGGEHARMRVASGGEAVAALATARGQDRATRTGAHAQSETVGLVTTTVVRLEGALAHGSSLHSRGLLKTGPRPGRRARHARGQVRQLAPLAHATTPMGSGAVVDMRHRSTPDSTCQRYALRDDRVKPSDGAQQHPVTGLGPAYVGTLSPRSTHPGPDLERGWHRPGVRRSSTRRELSTDGGQVRAHLWMSS